MKFLGKRVNKIQQGAQNRVYICVCEVNRSPIKIKLFHLVIGFMLGNKST